MGGIFLQEGLRQEDVFFEYHMKYLDYSTLQQKIMQNLHLHKIIIVSWKIMKCWKNAITLTLNMRFRVQSFNV
jgi:hypothetical protein